MEEVGIVDKIMNDNIVIKVGEYCNIGIEDFVRVVDKDKKNISSIWYAWLGHSREKKFTCSIVGRHITETGNGYFENDFTFYKNYKVELGQKVFLVTKGEIEEHFYLRGWQVFNLLSSSKIPKIYGLHGE